MTTCLPACGRIEAVTDAAPDLAEARSTLWQVTPEEFVAARDSLVKQLRAAGDKEAAAALKAERRPTRLLWALRTAAAQHGEQTAGFVASATAAAAAQSSGAGVRERTAELREAVSALASAVAGRAGVERTDVSGALLAIAADQDALAGIETGMLDAVPEPTGFGGIALGASAIEAHQPDPKPEPEIDRDAQRRARARLSAAKKRATAATRALERAEAAHARAADALDQAAARLDEARAEAYEAARELAAAEDEGAAGAG
jgi:hypothetical protein